MAILVGDLGGTHTRLALADLAGTQVSLRQVMRYKNAEYTDLNAILAGYLRGNASCAACCLAVAGPTDGRSVQFTNLAWRIDTDALVERFGFSRCGLINDFAAVGWGLNTLTADALESLQTGQPVSGGVRGAAVALGAGTGLGVSLCAWRDDHYQPLPSEGGHVGFAPRNSEQDRLLAFLRPLFGRVSVERILSGPGLVDLFRFCLSEAGQDSSPLLAAPHPAEAISQAGLALSDAVAAHCLRLFAEIYGQTAGDWALAAQASGGIFLAGGIAPKLLPVLHSGIFLAGFHAKGRYSEWMTGVPVAVILDPDIGLKGAAVAAAHLAAQSL
jgi:glucokinase